MNSKLPIWVVVVLFVVLAPIGLFLAYCNNP